jgi:hypothetical protein
MTKKANRNRAKKQVYKPAPWIDKKSGLFIITAVSIMLVIFAAWQYTPVVGLRDGILYGLLYGVMLWVVFMGSQFIFRWLRR